MGTLYAVGIVVLGVGVAGAAGLLADGLLNLCVSRDLRRGLWGLYWAGTVIGCSLLVWSALAPGWQTRLQALGIAGIVLATLSGAAGVGLAVDAAAGHRLCRGARRELWWMFWGGLIVGLFLVFGLQPLLSALGAI